MQRKDSEMSHKVSIFEPVMNRASIFEPVVLKQRLPSISHDNLGVIYKTVMSLSQKHQYNIQARRKANDAVRQAQIDHEQRQKKLKQSITKKERSIELRNNKQKRQRLLHLKQHQNHIQQVKTKIKNLHKQRQQRMHEQHDHLMERMQEISIFQRSKTLPHEQHINSLEMSQTIKKRKIDAEIQFSQNVLNQSIQKQQLSKFRIQQIQQQRMANIVNIDRRFKQAQQMVESNKQMRKKVAAERYIKSLHDSEVRLKDICKTQNFQMNIKVKNELEKQRRAVQNSKSRTKKYLEEVSKELELDNSKIIKAMQRRKQMIAMHISKHRKIREHEAKVMQSADKENESFVRNKLAQVQISKFKQEQMACYRRMMQKNRQEAMVDHFLNRNICALPKHPK